MRARLPSHSNGSLSESCGMCGLLLAVDESSSSDMSCVAKAMEEVNTSRYHERTRSRSSLATEVGAGGPVADSG